MSRNSRNPHNVAQDVIATLRHCTKNCIINNVHEHTKSNDATLMSLKLSPAVINVMYDEHLQTLYLHKYLSSCPQCDYQEIVDIVEQTGFRIRAATGVPDRVINTTTHL